LPLGVWLSGGIDSTAILHYAAAVSSSRLKSFSISFKGRSFDESSYIQTAVREYGTDHDRMDLNPAVDLRGAIEEFAYFCMATHQRLRLVRPPRSSSAQSYSSRTNER
jgi:asparagine synthase (glutamine-hydrolysing)